MQNGAVEAVPGVQRPGDDVIVSLEEAEVVGLEDEIGGGGEGLSPGLVAEGGELDAAVAAGLPVLVVADDLDGEDGVGAESGLEEVEKLGGGDGAGDVGDSDGGSLRRRRRRAHFWDLGFLQSFGVLLGSVRVGLREVKVRGKKEEGRFQYIPDDAVLTCVFFYFDEKATMLFKSFM